MSANSSLSRMHALRWLGPLLALSPVAAAHANTSEGFRAIVATQVAPTVLDAKEKAVFSAIYDAIRNQKWDEAARLIDDAPQGPMAAMARAGTVAVILPGAFYTLRETQAPPIAALRAAGVPMAVATDCNPGTSPLQSLRLAMSLACTHFRLTPEEALRGATVHAAQALGLEDRGRLVVGQRADFVRWRIGQPAQLAYWLGGDLVSAVHAGGRLIVGA